MSGDFLGTLSYMDEFNVGQPVDPLSSAPRQSVLHLSPDDRAPALARAHVRHWAEHLPIGVANDALLLTSELVSNAVEHGSPQIVLRVRTGTSHISVLVHDDGVDLPVLARRSPSSNDPHGRGLRIVAAIATRWGIDFATGGKSGKDVWFALAAQPDA